MAWIVQILSHDRQDAIPLQLCHNEHNGISNHQPYNYMHNCLFRCRSKKTSKLHVTGLCEGNSPVTGEFPAQRASNAENVSIWLRHVSCVTGAQCVTVNSIAVDGLVITVAWSSAIMVFVDLVLIAYSGFSTRRVVDKHLGPDSI